MIEKMLQLLLLVFTSISTQASAATSRCNQSCGSNSVPYPFGFSQGCPILLNCSSSSSSSTAAEPRQQVVQIGEFQVRNITSDSLLVDVPPSCNRSINAPSMGFLLGGHNYAMTWKNVLLVRGCTAVRPAFEDCIIPTALLSSRLNLTGCSPVAGDDNITCLSTDRDQKGFLNKSAVLAAGCGFLFTSIGYESSVGGDRTPIFAFRTVELGWWLDGVCRCSADATCITVTPPETGRQGFRCSCSDGFEGDGFPDGRGCQKVIAPSPRCNPSKYISSNCGGSSSRVALLVGGIAAGATVMAVLTLACCFIRRRSLSCRIRKSTKRMLSQASCTVPLYPYKDIERATNSFADAQRLGTGAYGTVYAGRLNNDKLVAVKKIKHAADGIDQVLNEVRLLSSVSHPNLVRLLGCCVERGEQILVYEFMPNGTLAQHLQRERGPAPLPWTVRLTIASETAKAIAYLHSAIHPPIYHRDIKSSNILLDYSYNSKVADFGLSRIGMTSESSHISTAPQGTPGYLDPQYHQNFHLSDKSDVYSFGVVLVEIITALKVVDFNRDQGEVNLAALAIDKIGKGCVDDIFDPCLEPNRDAWTLSSIHKVAELAFRCLAFHKDMRPSMMEVVDELELIRLSGWAPPDDVFMSPASSMCSSSRSGSMNNTAAHTGKSFRTKTKSRKETKTKSRKELVTVNVTTMAAPAEVKVDSPISVVQDPWLSEQSSPSSNCLLVNSTH